MRTVDFDLFRSSTISAFWGSKVRSVSQNPWLIKSPKHKKKVFMWESQFFGTSEFRVSKVSRERDWDTAKEKTQNKEKVTRGSVGDFLSRIAKVEKKKYNFGVLEVRRPEGGEDIEFELWHIKLSVHEIALTIGSRESSKPLISLKGGFLDFGNSGFGTLGVEE
jgi:hypothetical protein